jgi:N-acetylglucosamine kinase-like BadF-type ATPase
VTRRAGVLAVDGGGSKIDAALIRKDGTVLGAARTQVRDADRYGGEEHMNHIVDAVAAACADAKMDLRFPVADLGVYCLAGADLPADDRRIARWLTARGITGMEIVRNDTFAVLRAGTERPWGVSVVCGYGINCSGVSPDGRITRFPSVGMLSGDWGGGTDVGGAGMWHAIRAEDGRGEKTSLATMVPQHFGFTRPRQVLEAMYFGRLDEDRVAELTPTVFRAAEEGDAIARSIVDRQADEVIALAATAIRRLRMTKLDVDVVLGGGIFRNDDEKFFERIRHGLEQVAPAVRVRVLTAPPVIGAALMGLDRLEAPRPARARLRLGLTHERLTLKTHPTRKE